MNKKKTWVLDKKKYSVEVLGNYVIVRPRKMRKGRRKTKKV